MNLLHDHPSKDVRAALIRLLDALTTWNRTTGRSNIVIVKDTVEGGLEWRSLDGSPLPDDMTDDEALETFDELKREQP